MGMRGHVPQLCSCLSSQTTVAIPESPSPPKPSPRALLQEPEATAHITAENKCLSKHHLNPGLVGLA